MKRPSIPEIIYKYQFPNPKPNDPQNFYAYVQRHIVTEVRLEVQNFYGALDNLEAQYPGLDYTYDPHRRRLGRFTWHRRLFRAFDALGLTSDEILSICQWEGTKSAKDKYEAETGRIIKDTTFDGVEVAQPTQPTAIVHRVPRRQPSTETMAHIGALDEQMANAEQSDDDDDIQASVGAQLNNQLIAASEGESPTEGPLIEEWLKYMQGRELNRDSILQAIRAGHPPPTASESNIATNGTEPVTSGPSNLLFSSLHSISSAPHGYGPTNDEVLATLQVQERRVQA